MNKKNIVFQTKIIKIVLTKENDLLIKVKNKSAFNRFYKENKDKSSVKFLTELIDEDGDFDRFREDYLLQCDDSSHVWIEENPIISGDIENYFHCNVNEESLGNIIDSYFEVLKGSRYWMNEREYIENVQETLKEFNEITFSKGELSEMINFDLNSIHDRWLKDGGDEITDIKVLQEQIENTLSTNSKQK